MIWASGRLRSSAWRRWWAARAFSCLKVLTTVESFVRVVVWVSHSNYFYLFAPHININIITNHHLRESHTITTQSQSQ